MRYEPRQNDSTALELTLSPADAAALDALLADHAGEASAPASPDARSQRLTRLLGLLDTLPAADDARPPSDLTARTLSRIAQHQTPTITTLTDADAEAVDAWIDARCTGGGSTLRLAGESDGHADREDQLARRKAVGAVLGLLDTLDHAGADTDAAPADLTSRTLDRLAEQRQRERFAAQVDMMRIAPRGVGVSWRQVASAAAVFLLGVSVLLPMLERGQAEQMRAACMGNLLGAGRAFASYAADHAGVLPRGRSVPGSPWWNVGRSDAVDAKGNVYSNSAHLFLLVREQYISPEKLACQTNEAAPRMGMMSVQQLDWKQPMEVSYSYQNQFAARPLRTDDAAPTLAVLADKNPLFIVRGGRVVFDPSAPLTSPSVLHNGEGQNVLHIDGAAAWTVRPVVANTNPTTADAPREDNIWSLHGVARYEGTETPEEPARDSFLVP